MAQDKDKAEGRDDAGAQWGICPLAALFGLGGLKDRVLDCLPPEFVEHAAGARREVLLAVKSLIDEALRREEAQLAAYRRRQEERAANRPQKVAVE
ncbi:MAG TPA: hypothetical protein DHW14_06745 [Clostridiales bacterium]|nr:hypothetical protein [Clostridiales bacterium]